MLACLFHLGRSFKNSIPVGVVSSCIHNSLRKATCTSSLLWNKQPAKCYFNSPDNFLDCWEVPTECNNSCVVHSCQQKSIGLKFSKSQTGNDVWFSCHHNSSHFTFPIFAHSCHFSVLHSLQSITPRIY